MCARNQSRLPVVADRKSCSDQVSQAQQVTIAHLDFANVGLFLKFVEHRRHTDGGWIQKQRPPKIRDGEVGPCRGLEIKVRDPQPNARQRGDAFFSFSP